MVLAKEPFIKGVNSNIFPGIQGGPLMHVIAGKAVAILYDLAVAAEEHVPPRVGGDLTQRPRRGAEHGEVGLVERPPPAVSDRRQPDDLLAVRKRERPDHGRVQERERERAETQAAGQHQHRQERRARAAGQQPEGVADVAKHSC